MSRGSAPSTDGGGRRTGRELAARLAPCLYGHFPRIVVLLRLYQMDGDNQHFAHHGHHRQALFHATSHQALVVGSKGGSFQVNARVSRLSREYGALCHCHAWTAWSALS